MKKFVLLLITLCLSCVLFGCDGNSNTNDKPESTELERLMEKNVDYRPKDKFTKYYPKVRRSNGFADLILSLFQTIVNYGAYILAFFLVVGLIFLVYRLVPQIKGETADNDADADADSADSNTIFNHNYQKEIDVLVQNKNYKGAIRLLYLYTLYNLNNYNLVKWDVSKTPTEYYYELERPNLKSVFFHLTNVFLQVVYGNVEASAELFSQANEDARSIVKCITPVTK